MKPLEIKNILDLAYNANKLGKKFIPLFAGAPGIGKSEICQQWAKEKGIGLIDLRIAYLEAPDLIGFPSIQIKNNRQVTTHNIPDFWPTEGEGLLLLEEPNRGTTAIMNTLMQLLTDRKLHKYELPPGWIIASCINPETADYDVNAMDPALKNRFQIFDVEYDKKTTLKYMEDTKFDQTVIHFIESGTFKYSKPEDLGNIDGSKYVSPRTLSALDAAVKSITKPELELTVYESILGKNIGHSFYSFKHNELPVTNADIKKDILRSTERLKNFSDPKNYKMGHISITIKDIANNHDLSKEELKQVILAIPADQGPALLSEWEYVSKDNTITHTMMKDADILKHFRDKLT